MSTNHQDEEIDLGQLFKKSFNYLVNSIFDFIFFLKKRTIIILVLFTIGLLLGFYIDNKSSYLQEVTVIPNFGSNEYLYKKVEFLNSRLKEKDQIFFKSIGVNDLSKINKIDINAVNGIFSFVNMRDNSQNFELIKLMAEDGNLEEIIKSDVTSKNYYLHNISISTSDKLKNGKVVDSLLSFFQKNAFYERQQLIYQDNIESKITFNDSLLSQIDRLIIKLSENNTSSTSNISITENSSITALINKKDELMKDSQFLKINKHEYEDIIKVQNISLNNINSKGLNNKMKLILPVFLVFIYLFLFWFRSLYRQQQIRINK